MKITGIDISDYRQFRNLNFDFIYPTDHKTKPGQPLDKVCFIGQSGTGKTTLLNVIWDFFSIVNHSYKLSEHERIEDNSFLHYVKFRKHISMELFSNGKVSQFINKDLLLKIAESDLHTVGIVLNSVSAWILQNDLGDSIKFNSKLCLFIKDSIAREADAFLIEQPGQDSVFGGLIKTDVQVERDKYLREEIIESSGEEKIALLGDGQSLAIWRYLLKEIYEYDQKGQEQALSIMQKTGEISVDELINKLSALTQWKANTPNPRLDLAEKCLNPILNKFYVDVDTESAKVPIVLKTKSGVRIDTSTISTGIRQILATAIPIYKFDTTDTIILFDEPERSLFPDVQRELVKYYTGLAPTAQFFFATHSPIIAASFEPCERFILFFNENGEVDFHRGVAPEGDDPNDVLRQDFGMSPLMSDEGIRQYERYRQLAVEIRAETDEAKKNRLIADRVELGNRYNFAGQYASNQ